MEKSSSHDNSSNGETYDAMERSSSIASSSDEMEDDLSPDDFPTGQFSPDRMKSFRIDKILGKGSFGTAYQATHLPTGKVCVVKMIQTIMPETRDMALHEAHVGMTVLSENVCKTIAYTEDLKNVYIIMEYIEGMDLYEFIANKPGIFQKIPVLLLFVITKIVQGIRDFHEAGFVHGDIKPENIFIGLSQDKMEITCVKLMDFGLSKSESEIQGHSAGTYDYLAPEIAKKALMRNSKIDVWSFGITMYAMFMMTLPSCIASRNPDKELRRSEVLQNLRNLPMDKAPNLFKAMSTNPKYAMIQELIISALTVNPLHRPTPQELLEKVREISPHFQGKDS
jgi:serine/threonine protein kinase